MTSVLHLLRSNFDFFVPIVRFQLYFFFAAVQREAGGRLTRDWRYSQDPSVHAKGVNRCHFSKKIANYFSRKEKKVPQCSRGGGGTREDTKRTELSYIQCKLKNRSDGMLKKTWFSSWYCDIIQRRDGLISSHLEILNFCKTRRSQGTYSGR